MDIVDDLCYDSNDNNYHLIGVILCLQRQNHTPSFSVDLVKIRKDASNTYTYYFTKPSGLTWEEGAHTHLALDRFDHEMGWFQKKDVRHFSIYSLEDEEYLAISTRIPDPASDFKEVMKSAKVGDQYHIFKVGTRLKLRRKDRPVVLLTAGVAMATIRPLVKAYEKNQWGIPSMIHLNIDSSGEYLYREEFRGFQESMPYFQNHHVSSRPEFYQELTRLSNQREADYYVIGGYEFLVDVYKKLHDFGIADDHIIVDTKEGVAALQMALSEV